MIQGTSSHAGKSVFVAALLRILKNKGISCAPFKPQNMALNSFVTPEGCEIGRAQAMQAEAAKIQPSFHMNPILLKPSADNIAQVILQGKPWKNLSAKEYITVKKTLRPFVKESFLTLSKNYDVVVVEGAGSPAEINLRKDDLANMGFAQMFKIPVLIVGDIDRGGIYASFYGTYAFLKPSEKKLLKGFVINKFRGDKTLLEPANEFLKKKTGVSVIGIVPYFKNFVINDEDGVSLTETKQKFPKGDNKSIKVRIVKLPRISNFTDFEPLFLETDVDVSYVSAPAEASDAHFVIIPGSKNTIEDLLFLKETGFDSFLKKFIKKGGFLAGICGGYQMLGNVVKDPYSVESKLKEITGLGFLNIQTVLDKDKQLKQVTFKKDGIAEKMIGYEIHMGSTNVMNGKFFFTICNDDGTERCDGVAEKDGRVFGTYIHGLFDNDEFRLYILNKIREAFGFKKVKQTYNYRQYKDNAYDQLATHFENSLDVDYVMSVMGF